MRIGRSATTLFLANAGKALLLFAGTAYFSQVLGGAGFAPAILFEALLGLLSIPADMGLRGAVEKRISEGDRAGVVVATSLVLKTVPLLLVGGVVLLFRGQIAAYLGAPLASLLVLTLAVQEAALVCTAAVRGELRVSASAPIMFSKYAGWVGIGVVLVQFGYGALAPVYGLLGGNVVALLWAVATLRATPGRPAVATARSLVRYARYNVVSDIGGYAYNWIDVLVLGLFVAPASVTAYEIAWRVSMTVMTFSAALSDTIFPQISAWDADGSKRRIEQLLPHMLALSIFVAVPSFFGALLYADAILAFVFAPEYTIAAVALVVLMGEKVFQSVHAVLGRTLQAIDRPDLAAMATVLAIAVNVVFNVVLIQAYGIVGAAAATALSFLLNTVAHGYFVAQFLSIEIPARQIAHSVLSAVAMTAGLLLVRQTFGVTTPLALVGNIFLGGFLYVVAMLLSRQVRWTVRYSFRAGESV
ncbi:polysaccharide biosynthesis C-terminal domain-containing protein [Halomicroarcula sp. S1AR25-4]|uniref:oligosaccharide flippase family protein n=1 Tax=Haloarcula sp. S1AR25-4 TaxID=2950538 RepID=UPI002874FF16|nr:polysaccharide biosynthesis C-terminal domain-containing protein [Halomicroarcula sp. S1AR25-4]MDS0278508.1 polysaccharide biosynthesis C-terminal domain-containing protein [Halomicroarcula sp. S1AR25-4]